jgi:shikimate dehydrogenase
MIRPLPPLFIIGSPIGHSLSPLLHNAALHQLGIPLSYEAIEIRMDELQDLIREVRLSNVVGFNVTIPHKETIIPLLDKFDESARRIGAVNTVVKDDRGLIGYNTDIDGVEQTLAPYRSSIMRTSALLIGAGGAARALVYVLKHSFGVLKFSLATRSVKKAESLISDLEIENAEIIPWEEFRQLRSHNAKLMINATPLGMHPRVDESPLGSSFRFTPNQIAFDVVYRPEKPLFLRHAERNGSSIITGLPMLLHQAVASFKLWTGKEMPLSHATEVLLHTLSKIE